MSLGGEKIDVVEWADDPARYVANALSPGPGDASQHRRGHQDRHGGQLERQLSLAIGKEGQNARLAAKLTRLAH